MTALPPWLGDVDDAAAAIIAVGDAAAAHLLLHGDENRAREWFGDLLAALLRPAQPSSANGGS